MSLVSNKTVPLPHSLSRFLQDPCRLSPLVSILPSRSFALFSTLAEISPVFAHSYENYPRAHPPRHQIGTIVPTARTHRFPYARLSIAIFHFLFSIFFTLFSVSRWHSSNEDFSQETFNSQFRVYSGASPIKFAKLFVTTPYAVHAQPNRRP